MYQGIENFANTINYIKSLRNDALYRIKPGTGRIIAAGSTPENFKSRCMAGLRIHDINMIMDFPRVPA